jgi:hypothetical protein
LEAYCNIVRRRGHQHSGHDFVAVGDQDQSVKGVPFRHGFNGVRHQFPAGKRIFHPFMAHCDTVADRDGREFHGSTSRHGNAFFGRFRDAVQVHMPRYDLVLRIDDADDRPIYFFTGIAHSVKKCAY